jgi:diacylglycerol kinase family enzyme
MTTVAGTRAKVFVNASSGWDAKQDAPERLRAKFEASGIETHVEYVGAGVNLAQKSRDAVAEGTELVVAGGGDGTISAAASGVAGTETCFGILPVGTLNHFARDLKLPLDLDAAADVIVNGNSAHVDVAEVNGKIFINNSIIGLYPIYRFLKKDNERRVGSKRLALLMAVASIVRRYPILNVRLHAGGAEIARKTPYVLVANNRHAMEGYHLGRRDSLTEGKLWIYVMRNRGRWGLFRLLAKLIAGRFRGEKEFEIFSAEEVWVELNRGKKAGVALDGEVTVMETPLHYRILPRALKVRVPRAG